MVLLCAFVFVGQAPSASTSHRTARAELLVGFERGVSPAAQRALLVQLGAAPEERFAPIRGYLASVPAGSRREALAALEDDQRVRYAEPTVRFRVSATPDDPSFPQLWGLHNVGQTGVRQRRDGGR